MDDEKYFLSENGVAKLSSLIKTDLAKKADKTTTYTKIEVVSLLYGAIGTLDNLKTAVKNTIVNAINWLFEQVASLLDIMGMYEDREPITLEADQIGKAIVPISAGSVYGKAETYAGATISREYSLTRGDMLLMKTGKTSNDIFTVSQVTTNSDGSKTYTKVMSLNAMAEVPTDGYLRFLVMPSDMTIVVTYFPAEPSFSSTIRVKRCGAFATISSQVGNIYEDLKQNYAKKDGYYAGMRVANSDALAPMGGNAPVYDEIITAGRMVNDAPDLIGSRTPSATNADSNIALRDMRGEVFGVNQMMKYQTDPSKYYYRSNGGSEVVHHDGYSVYTTAGETTGYARIFAESFLPNHTYLAIALANNENGVMHFLAYKGSIEQQSILMGKKPIHTNIFKTGATIEPGFSIVEINTQPNSVLRLEGGSLLDLTTLFPTPEGQSFVNSLTSSSAIKVIHRLGISAYTRNGSVATQLNDETLSLGASMIAKLGFQEPKLCTGTVGRFHLIDGNTGNIKQTLDMRAKKNAAWTQVLAKLAEQGIDISADLAKPIEASYDGTSGIIWDDKGVTVSALEVDLGEGNWRYIEGVDSGTKNIFSLVVADTDLLKTYDNNFIMLGYTKSQWGRAFNTDSGYDQIACLGYYTAKKGFSIKDTRYTDLASFKEHMKGQKALIELTTPIRIDFEDDMNLNLVDVKPYDLYALDDMDGEPMYDIHIEQLESGEYKTTVAPSATWVEQHHQLPVPIRSAIVGLGTQVNYDFVMNLYNEVQELKARN